MTTRWALNVATGKVKHWNINMIGVENIVECTADGIPLTTAKYLESLRQKDTETKNVIENVETEVMEAEKISTPIDTEPKPVKLTAEELSVQAQELEDREAERTRRMQVYMAMTKKNLIVLARNNGIQFTGTDTQQRNKEWFAVELVKAEMDMSL